MKKIILCFSLVITVLFTGCFNYRDIDKVIFVTAVIIDVDNTGNPVLYVEAFKPSRGAQGSSGKGERVLFQGTGKTMYEIVRDLNLSSSYKLNYTQNRGVIFTQKAAEKGLDNFIDFFDRDQETVVRAKVAVYNGDPQKLLNAKLKEQEYIGLFINDLIYNIKASSRGVILSLNDFLNRSFSKNNTAVITSIAMKSDQPEDKIEISEAAIFKDFKLVDSINRRQTEGYNFLINNIRGGTLEVGNPSSNGKFITLEILKNNTNTNMQYDGKMLKIKKIIKTRVHVNEVQGRLRFDKSQLDQIANNAQTNISRECMRIFEDYKKRNLDIFDIQETFQRKYPHEKIKDVISISQLEVEVHVTIEGSTDTMDFRYGSQ